MSAFVEQKILDTIKRLSKNRRLIFAASVVERLFVFYAFYCKRLDKDASDLRAIADTIWEVAAAVEISKVQLEHSVDACLRLAPDEGDGPWFREIACAEDAVASIVFVLSYMLDGDPMNLMWAARRAYDTADFLDQMKPSVPAYIYSDQDTFKMVEITALSDCLTRLLTIESRSNDDLVEQELNTAKELAKKVEYLAQGLFYSR